MAEEYKLPIPGFKLLSAEAANEQIADLIGMTFAIFTNTVLFCQKTRGRNVTDFLDCSDTEQKELFGQLFGLEAYAEGADLIQPDAKLSVQTATDAEQNFMLAVSELERLEARRAELATSRDAFLADHGRRLTQQKEHHDALLLQLSAEGLQQLEEDLAKRLVETDQQLAKKRSEIAEIRGKQTSTCSALAVAKQKITMLEGLVLKLKVPSPELATKPSLTEGTLDALLVEEKQVRADYTELVAFQSQKDQERSQHRSDLRAAEQVAKVTKEALDVGKQRQTSVDMQRRSLQQKIDEITVCPTCKQEFATEAAKETAVKDLLQRITVLEDIELPKLEEDCRLADTALANLKAEAFDHEEYDKVVAAIKENAIYLAQVEKTVQAKREELRSYEKWEIAVKSREQTETTRATELQKAETELQGLLPCPADFQQMIGRQQASIDTGEAELQILVDQRAEIVALQKQSIEPIKSAYATTSKQLQLIEAEVWLDQPQFDTTEQKIAANEKLKTELEANLKKVKLEAELYEHLQQAFGPEGVVAELFREFIPDLQRTASDLLLDLTNGELKITFSPTRTLKKKEAGQAITRAQFDIQLEKLNGGSDYELISGSEQDKAALIVSWALSILAAEHSNVTSNLRVFDEAFESLDPKGMERLAAMIERRAELSGQITEVITHKAELDFPKKIMLAKRNGATILSGVII